MRQVISLIKDDQVHYAVVDDDTGEMVPFASIHLPDPDRFGLHEAAVLGTNLIEAIGLNGKRPKVKQQALPAAGPVVLHEHTGEGDMRTPPPKRSRGPRRDINLDEVLAVINEYPEGITSRQIAERIWRQRNKPGTVEQWLVKGVENRIRGAEDRPNTPFRTLYRAEGNFKRKYVLPLAPLAGQPQPQPNQQLETESPS